MRRLFCCPCLLPLLWGSHFVNRSNLWRSNLKKGSSDDLVRMILNEQNRDIYRIAGNLRIDLHELRIMWAILPKGAVGVSEDAVSQQKQQVKEYLCGAKKTAIVDVFDQGIVAFMNDAPYPGIDGELAQDFMAEFGRAHPDTVLIWCGGLECGAFYEKNPKLDMIAVITVVNNVLPICWTRSATSVFPGSLLLKSCG